VKKIMRFGPITFSDDTELTDSITSFGPLVARGNLLATHITTNGPCTVSGTFELDDLLRVNGPLIVKGSLVLHKGAVAKVNGPANIQKGIIGGVVRVNGPLKAEYIEARSIKINGPLTVEQDVVAGEEIVIGVGRSSKMRKGSSINVGGIIEAPVVRLKNYSRALSPGRIIKKVLGVQEKFIRETMVEGLTIKADILELEGIELENCNLDQVTEIVRLD
jgi:hypothetical protein